MNVIKKIDLHPILLESLLADQFETENTIEIPKKYVLTNNVINIVDEKSFYNVMEILRFFMVRKVPFEIYDYLMVHKETDLSQFKDFFFEELEFVKQLTELHAYNTADYGYLNILKYLNEKKYDMNVCFIRKKLQYSHYRDFDEGESNEGENYPPVYPCDIALTHGYFDCFEILKNNYDLNDKQKKYMIARNASYHNNLEYLKQYYQKKFNQTEQETIMRVAVSSPYNHERKPGQSDSTSIDIVKYLLNVGCHKVGDGCHGAMSHKKFKLLKYLYENGFPLSHGLCQLAIRWDNIEILKYLLENGCLLHTHSCNGIHGECLKYIFDNNKNLLNNAVMIYSIGHVDTVKFFFNNNIYNYDPITSYPTHCDVIYTPVKNKNLELLKIIHEQFKQNLSPGVYWTNEMYNNILHQHGVNTLAKEDDDALKILKYLHDNKCPYDNKGYFTLRCAQYGYIKCLKFLHENGYKFNDYACTSAISSNNIKCFDYIREIGYNIPDDICKHCKNIQTLEYLISLGYKSSGSLLHGILQEGDTSSLKYIIDNNAKLKIWANDEERNRKLLDPILSCNFNHSFRNDERISNELRTRGLVKFIKDLTGYVPVNRS